MKIRVLFVCFLGGMIGYLASKTAVSAYVNWKNEQASIMRENIFFDQIFRHIQGGAEGFGNYNLISLDGGKTWYEADRENSNEVLNTVHGSVTKNGWTNIRPVRPGLLDGLKIMGLPKGYGGCLR